MDGEAEMTAAVSDLVFDRTMRDRIAAHNRAVAPAFDWADVLARTADLYRAAAGQVRVPARPLSDGQPALALEA